MCSVIRIDALLSSCFAFMRSTVLPLILISFSNLAQAQGIGQTIDFSAPEFHLKDLPQIDDELSADFFYNNRERLRDTLPDSAMVVLFSAPQKSKSNDIDFRYHQDPDFYYFTGIREPNAMMILFKNPIRIGEQWLREVLFIEEKNDKKEQWTGKMLNTEDAKELSKIQMILPNVDFKTMSFPWEEIKTVYSNQHQHIERDDKEHPGDLKSMVYHFDAKLNRASKKALVNETEDLFAYLRQKKTAEEVVMIQRAVDITCQAQLNAFRQIKGGMTEYQVEALINYTFRALGADGEAFPTIVASGDNGSIMHYTANEAILILGDLVIMDIGAQYEGYSADVTRTVPVSGKFSPEQAAVYQVVLDAQTVAIRYATPGYKFWTPHEEAYRTIGKGLIKLGIITEWGDIGKYFIHGTSHYLGLDVHDAGVYSSLAPGDVMTVEPGIYIPKGSPCDPKWWGIFVRIEDDILITSGAAKVLSDSAPKTIAEIEAIMAKS
jgi:Xaa-Pro aminopeptidase